MELSSRVLEPMVGGLVRALADMLAHAANVSAMTLARR